MTEASKFLGDLALHLLCRFLIAFNANRVVVEEELWSKGTRLQRIFSDKYIAAIIRTRWNLLRRTAFTGAEQWSSRLASRLLASVLLVPALNLVLGLPNIKDTGPFIAGVGIIEPSESLILKDFPLQLDDIHVALVLPVATLLRTTRFAIPDFRGFQLAPRGSAHTTPILPLAGRRFNTHRRFWM